MPSHRDHSTPRLPQHCCQRAILSSLSEKPNSFVQKSTLTESTDVHWKQDLSVAYQVTQIPSSSSKGCHCHPSEQTKLRFAMEPPGAALQLSRHRYRLWHDLVPCRAQDLDLTCFPPSEAAFHPLHTSVQLAEQMGFTPTVLGTAGFRSPCNTSLFFHWPRPSSL